MHRASNMLRLSTATRPCVSVATTSDLSELVSRLSLTGASPSATNTTTAGNAPLINYESRRFGRRYRRWHHWPNDFLPFQWSRPVLPPPHLRTGDAVNDIGKWDPKALVLGAEHSKELANAPEIVRRLFTLEFAERKDVVAYQTEKIVKHMQRDPFDTKSYEVRIAKYTVKIRNNLHHFLKIDKYDAPRKIRQDILKNRRNKALNQLYYQDRARYEHVIKLLGITHERPQLGVITEKPTRKGELKRLTREYCDKIKEERLAAYHEELKQKRTTLEDEIKKVNEMIAEDEKYLGIHNAGVSEPSTGKSNQ